MQLKQALLLVIICCILFLSGCGNTEQLSTWTTDPSGNRVLSNQMGDTVFPDALPAHIAYNSSDIAVTDVAMYQSLSTQYYSYTLFLVVAIDVSNLDDAQRHWLRESDIEVNAYLTSEKNKYDFDSMSILGNLLITNQGIVYYVMTSSFFKDNRYDFAGSEITLSVNVKQEETYEYRNSSGDIQNLNKEDGIHYSFDVGNDLPDPDQISEPLYGYISEWLVDYRQRFQ